MGMTTLTTADLQFLAEMRARAEHNEAEAEWIARFMDIVERTGKPSRWSGPLNEARLDGYHDGLRDAVCIMQSHLDKNPKSDTCAHADLAEIEKNHAHDMRRIDPITRAAESSGPDLCAEAWKEAHADRATLLAHLKSAFSLQPGLGMTHEKVVELIMQAGNGMTIDEVAEAILGGAER